MSLDRTGIVWILAGLVGFSSRLNYNHPSAPRRACFRTHTRPASETLKLGRGATLTMPWRPHHQLICLAISDGETILKRNFCSTSCRTVFPSRLAGRNLACASDVRTDSVNRGSSLCITLIVDV